MNKSEPVLSADITTQTRNNRRLEYVHIDAARTMLLGGAEKEKISAAYPGCFAMFYVSSGQGTML